MQKSSPPHHGDASEICRGKHAVLLRGRHAVVGGSSVPSTNIQKKDECCHVLASSCNRCPSTPSALRSFPYGAVLLHGMLLQFRCAPAYALGTTLCALPARAYNASSRQRMEAKLSFPRASSLQDSVLTPNQRHNLLLAGLFCRKIDDTGFGAHLVVRLGERVSC